MGLHNEARAARRRDSSVTCMCAPVMLVTSQQRQLVVRTVVVNHRGVRVLHSNVIEQQHALFAALAAVVRVAQVVQSKARQPLDDGLPVDTSQIKSLRAS